MSEAVKASDVQLSYGRQLALRGVDLEVARGELLVLLGPSGCGKTSLLRALAGLEVPDSGRIEIGGRLVYGEGRDVEPAARGVGFVFQDLGLWPGMTVLDHLLFVLGPGAPDRKNKSLERLRDLHIDHLAGKKPAQLSGGEAQRLALARALVSEPELIFLDEPLSSLDPLIAAEIRDHLKRIHRQEERSMIYVTHDRDEAFELADRILLMRDGAVIQDGRPEDLALRPRDAFAARFLGLGGLIAARESGPAEVETALGRHRLAEGSPASSGVAFVGRRQLRLAEDGTPTRVVAARFRGDDWAIEVELEGARLELRSEVALEIGAEVGVQGPEAVWCLDAEGGRA